MMERLYRIAVMTAANTHRAFGTPANIIWTWWCRSSSV